MFQFRTKNVHMVRKMIESLKEKPRTKAELMEIFMKNGISKEAARKRVERYTKTLMDLGLVKKSGDVYQWYIYMNVFEGYEDYRIKLEHSRMLIPALKGLAEVNDPRFYEYDFRTREKMLANAEKHLQSYPDYEILATYKRLSRELKDLERELKRKLLSKLKGSRINYDLNLINQIIYCLCNRIDPERLENLFESKKGELWFRNVLVGEDSDELREFIKEEIENQENIRAAERIQKTMERVSSVYEELRGKIQDLVLRIESGEPLLGKCDTCPEVKIKG